jgi:hypothetical protein
MAAKEMMIPSEEVHAAPLALGTTGGLAIQLRHAGLWVNALGQSQTMVAVSRYKGVFGPGGGHTARGYGFLPNIGMKKTTYFTGHFIHFFRLQFKLAYQLHQFVPV